MYNAGGAAEAGQYGTDYNGGLGGMSSAFGEKAVRAAFIRKVYGLLTAQLMVTLAFISVFTFSDGVKMFAYRNSWLLWVALGMTFVILIMLACCGDMRRQSPQNIILLGLFTIAESFLLGAISGRYRTDVVFIAIAITAFVTLALTLFAFQTKIDFTVLNGIMFVAVMILMVFGLVLMFWRSEVARLVYAALGALIFSVYIIIDTQMMIGGNHKYQISPEEYISATLTLYIDIVQLFMFILQIVGAASNDN